MNIRAASLLFAFVLGFSVLPARAQGPGGPPPNYQQLVSQLNALAAQVTTLQGQVAKLEGNITAADLAGTYSLIVLDTSMRSFRKPTENDPGEDASITTTAIRATLTLNANGTGNVTDGTFEGGTLTQGSWTVTGFSSSAAELTGVTWTYADGVITITFLDDGDEIPFNVAAGGRLLTVAFSPFHPSDPSSDHVLMIATRLR